jgi:hypothetical protein
MKSKYFLYQITIFFTSFLLGYLNYDLFKINDDLHIKSDIINSDYYKSDSLMIDGNIKKLTRLKCKFNTFESIKDSDFINYGLPILEYTKNEDNRDNHDLNHILDKDNRDNHDLIHILDKDNSDNHDLIHILDKVNSDLNPMLDKYKENKKGIKNSRILLIASKEALLVDPNFKADFYCNGTRDDLIIQQALNSFNATDNGIVQLTSGVYNFNGNIEMNSGTVLKGNGIDQTILRLVPDAGPFRKAGLIRGFEINNIKISDLTLDGNRMLQSSKDPLILYGKYGFYCESCIDLLLENVRIMSFQGYGFDPHGRPEEAVYTERLTIRNCIAFNNAWDGYTIDKTMHTVIENSIATDNGLLD